MVVAAASGVVAADDDRAADDARPPVAARWPRLASGPLQDNSFLIEEAYNQEAGVVQHILTATRTEASGAWQSVFTQEWPAPDVTHQLSFTVPHTASAERGERDGVGDVLLNYRYQLLLERPDRPAVAPRLSLVLPTGSVGDGRGNGSLGVQILVPVSKQCTEHFAVHLNAGMTVLPHARAVHPSQRADLVSWTGGAGVVWEPWNAINFLTEILASDDAEIAPRGVRREAHVIFDPGVRVGWNGPWGVQWAAGVGVPIGLTRGSDALAVFLYLSAEHAVTAAARQARNW